MIVVITKYFFSFSVQSGVLLMDPPIVVDDYEDNSRSSNYPKTSASRSLSVTAQHPAIVVRRRTTYANGVQGRLGGGGGVQRSMSLSLRRPSSMSCINTSSSGLRRIMPGEVSCNRFRPEGGNIRLAGYIRPVNAKLHSFEIVLFD